MKIYADSSEERLICVDSGADAGYWDAQWSQKAVPDPQASGREFTRITGRYLPAGSRILEGGCGLGDKVAALKLAGFEPIGLDFAEATVARVKELMPDLKIISGDVRDLPFDNETFDGYWSLGVIEHFWGGYDQILNEAFRVIKPGGFLFLTFPSMSPLRLHRYRNHFYPELDNKMSEPKGFYQFMLNPKTVLNDLEQLGFHICQVKRRSVNKGINDDLPRIKQLLHNMERQLPRLIFRASRFSLQILLRIWCGHGTLIVAKKGVARG